jgi:Vault protein inter-alpha-trypsin domain/von Willebrand factor type A domain
MTFKVGRRLGLALSLTLGLSFTALFAACRLEPPPIVRAPFGGSTDGPRFFVRTASGEERTLTLRQLAVQVTTRPGTVRSHLTMEIAGPPATEKAEAILRLAIPRGAAVTGAVLWVDGHPRNGAFVERERAREVYRSIVAGRRDPALVTWDGPGWVWVSIFPLGGDEPRRFELEWVEPAAVADGFVQYRAPTVGEGGRILGRASVTMGGRTLTGSDPLQLEPEPATAARIVDGQAPGDPFHRILVRAPPAVGPPQVVLIVETSAAVTAAERIEQRTVLGAVLDALPREARVTLVGADWDLSLVADQVDPAEARRHLPTLDAIPSAGALHLERALTDAVGRARKTGAGAVLFIGHGADAFWGDALRAPLERLRSAGLRLSVVGVNGASPPLADAAALTGGEMVTARGFDAAQSALLGALGPRPPRPGLTARGLDDWRPLETVTGQTVWLGRALEAPKATAGSNDRIASTDMSDLLPLWDRARLFTAGREGRANAEATMPLALTPLRALLVLESGGDYARFGLDPPPPLGPPRALAEDQPPAKRPDTRSSDRQWLFGLRGPADSPDRALGGRLGQDHAGEAEILGALGPGYGLVGTGAARGIGAGGVGTAEGKVGLGNLGAIGHTGSASDVTALRRHPPGVYLGTADPDGNHDLRVLITRIIRRHLNEMRYCYELGLARRPDLGGNLTVKLTVGGTGRPEQVDVPRSTLQDSDVENCIVRGIYGWTFPAPPGGRAITVSYPVVLTPGEPPPALEIVPTDGDPPATEALGILAGPGPLEDRVQRVASRLGLDGASDAESLAWTLDRHGASRNRIILVARLLTAAHRERDAVRVLSEHAPSDREAIGAEMRRLGADADAAELVSLAERGR